MDADDASRLIEGGESLTCEFKRGSINDRHIAETAMCLANGLGGVVLLGVEDDGTITGGNDGNGRPRRALALEGMIRSKTVPPVDVVVTELGLDGEPVFAIEIAQAGGPTGTLEGVYKRRALKHDGTPACVPYLPHEMVSRYYAEPQNDHALTIVRGVRFQDLDPLEFDRVRKLAVRPGGDATLLSLSDQDIARALEVVAVDEHGGIDVTLGGVLLFGTPELLQRHVGGCEIAFQESDGTALRVNDIRHLPLFAAAEYLHERLEARNPVTSFEWGLQRISLPRFPERVIREVVANALVHRDFTQLGPVRVELTPDELRVSNPGGFPAGITVANIMEESRPRSRVLANAFKRAAIVDRSGQGVKIMTESLLRDGRGLPDYSSTTDVTVVASIPSADVDVSLVKFMIDQETRDGRPMGLRELQVLRALRVVGPMNTVELADRLAIPVDVVRSIVVRGVSRGIVETRGHGRGQTVHLPSAFFTLTGEADEYARSAIAGRIRQQEMVLQYVDIKGKIARREASELLRLPAVQAGRLLQRMAREGTLESRGENRGAHYVRPPGSN